jgi:hypothetical protein
VSTKGTRRFEYDKESGQGFHLYDDVFDEVNVYLEFEGFQFEAHTSVELSGNGLPRLIVKLPLAWADKLGLIRYQRTDRLQTSEEH